MRVSGRSIRAAVYGGTGLLGEALLAAFERAELSLEWAGLYGADEDAGDRVKFLGDNQVIRPVSEADFRSIDLLYLVEPQQAEQVIELARASGSVVIDLRDESVSGAMDVIPLLEPESLDTVTEGDVICFPPVVASNVALVLNALERDLGLVAAQVTALLSAAHYHRDGVESLARQTVALLNFQEVEQQPFGAQLAFNALPQSIAPDWVGKTAEWSGLSSACLGLTSTLIPSFHADSYSIFLNFKEKVASSDVAAVFSKLSWVAVHERLDPVSVMLDEQGKSLIHLQLNDSQEISSLWFAADPIWRGRACHAVECTEVLLKNFV